MSIQKCYLGGFYVPKQNGQKLQNLPLLGRIELCAESTPTAAPP